MLCYFATIKQIAFSEVSRQETRRYQIKLILSNDPDGEQPIIFTFDSKLTADTVIHTLEGYCKLSPDMRENSSINNERAPLLVNGCPFRWFVFNRTNNINTCFVVITITSWNDLFALVQAEFLSLFCFTYQCEYFDVLICFSNIFFLFYFSTDHTCLFRPMTKVSPFLFRLPSLLQMVYWIYFQLLLLFAHDSWQKNFHKF